MDQDQQQQPQQPETSDALEHRLNEMAAVVAEMRRQQSELQSEMQRQAELHEKDRKRWHEECRQMQEERERLLKQAVATASPEKPTVRLLKFGRADAKSGMGGVLAMSRAIGGSSQAHSPNRPRAFHTLPDGLREKILEVVREKRQHLANELQRYKQAVETDQTARALDTLSISETSSRTSAPSSPLKFPLLPNVESLATFGRQIEDLAKRRRMQQQLASVLHAQNCTSEGVDAMGNSTCPWPTCSITTKVLEHMRACTFVTRCPTPMCCLTREVMHHYKNCKATSCQICQPAKQESMSTQEQLIRFMDTICKGLDDETPAEAPIVPTVVDPTSGLISLDTRLPMPMMLPTFFTPISFFGRTDDKKEETAVADMKMEGSDAQE